jgi:hypothetical protein
MRSHVCDPLRLDVRRLCLDQIELEIGKRCYDSRSRGNHRVERR